MTTLVTGASGFLGQEMLKEIIERKDEKFLLLLRDRSFIKFSKSLKEFAHITLAKGQLDHPDLFIDTRVLEKAKKEVTTVIHLGALYDLNAKKEELYKTNVIGTQNVLFFCQEAENVKKIIHSSTIAVAGEVDGPYSNLDFDLGQDHANPYAKTKFEAERLVRNFSNENPTVQTDIIRLGVIVGDTKEGRIVKEDGPYYIFKNIGKVLDLVPALTKLNFIPFPFKGSTVLPIVPVDSAAKMFWNMLEEEHSGLVCRYAIAKNPPSMKKFLEDFLEEINLPMKVIALPGGKIFQKGIKKGLSAIQLPEALTDYLYLKTRFINIDSGESIPVAYSEFKNVFFKAITQKYLSNFKKASSGSVS